MRGLTKEQILQVWEAGTALGTAERALLMLVSADPSRARDELAALPLGQRDALLLDLRRLTFGPAIEAQLECPHCGEQLESRLSCDALAAPAGAANGVHEAEVCGTRIAFRLPNSGDLIAIATIPDCNRAARTLAARCVHYAGSAAPNGAPEVLGPDLESALAARIAELDPLVDVEVSTTCPCCGQLYSAPFDIADYMWREICGSARRLLAEVHTLASAYGWSENEILVLSDGRRSAYLELAL